MTEVMLCVTVMVTICWVICLKMDIQTLKDENEKLRSALKISIREKTSHGEVAKSTIPVWSKPAD